MPESSWFVETRGYLPDQDYSWQPAGAGGQDARAAAELLARGCRGRSLYELIDDSASSLLLYCADGGAGTWAEPVWLLLITGFRRAAEDPTDHMGRTIRASVLGTGTGRVPPEDLLAVAHRFLEGRLTGPLPVEYGLPDGTPGFAVDPEGWAGLLQEAREGLPAEPPQASRIDPDLIRVDRDTADTRSRAATILREVDEQARTGVFDPARARLTGGTPRPLLVVTTLLGEDSLLALRPLHALSPYVDRRKESNVHWEGSKAQGFFSWALGVKSLLAAAGLALLAVAAVAVWR
ncbi:hypothetical protein DEJ50_01835 [Streptomyces venezuelae]|uniref:Uncharacterized protein n=1 Tax=Streptomyces venezuelae TaxID=54571 RepID=A0A5P2CWY0_STRVZ|nr:hypothetical protein [Streptomyces venezuelae]QES46780.1 hypothetical protein DEJ50_01835 [Streptomyces venezuelae]